MVYDLRGPTFRFAKRRRANAVASTTFAYADVAQLAEQLICNQQVIGSSPIIGLSENYMGGFPSGQRGQTVNLLQIASVVRIHLRPFDHLIILI